MRNWKTIANGFGTGASGAEVEQIAPALEALEAVLRPAIAALPQGTEPAVVFAPPPEDVR